MRVAVCVSGFDDEHLLVELARSVAPLGWPVVYGDGAYELFVRPGAPFSSPRHLAVDALAEADVEFRVFGPRDAPWPSEAAKKTAILDVARAEFAPQWVLFLDTDERVELPAGPDALNAWIDRELYHTVECATVNLWRPDQQPWCPEGLRYPRLLRLTLGLAFCPPRDFDVFDGERRVAWPEIESVAEVPVEVLRVRHDRQLRDPGRLARSGEYYRRRKAAHGGGVV